MTHPAKRLHVWDAPTPRDVGRTAEEFLNRLGGPTVIHARGQDDLRTRAVVTLLHGNEPSGLRALHAWLREGRTPLVNAVCVVASVAAAREGRGFAYRFLPGQRDLNRCFLPPFDGAQGELAREILEVIRDAGCEAMVDIHNNTGHNPPYGVGTQVDAKRLKVSSLFARRYIHTDLRLGCLIEAIDDDLPGVVIECGRAGDRQADAVALAGLQQYLGLDQIFSRGAEPGSMTILDTPVRVCLRARVQLAVAGSPVPGAHLTVMDKIDRHNFQELTSGTLIGWVDAPTTWPLDARGAEGKDVSKDLFAVQGRELRTRRPLIPIMMTTDARMAAADCLCYVVRPRTDRTTR